MTYDAIVIGGGIVGAATFYKLQLRNPNLKLLLLEKEAHPAAHQTGHNSGVIHSGLYYKPGSLKAINCVKGREELVAFAKENDISHDVCGKVVVATSESELSRLEGIMATGQANGLDGIKKLSADEVKEFEPFVECIAGLWVPQTGIIDFVGATEKMISNALSIQNQSTAKFREEVMSITDEGDLKMVRTKNDAYKSKYLIVCAGLQADRLARKDGLYIPERVVGFRGDYYELAHHARHKVRNLIYPVPDPAFPFLGVHFTRMVNGEIECGPNAVFTFKREGYGKTDFNLRDTASALGYKGTWNLFFNHKAFAINEYRRAFSKKLFLKTLQRMIPSLNMDDLVPGRSGVRAMLLSQNGDTKDDFRIEYANNSIHVLNAPSPAATASLAIGGQIADMAEAKFAL